MVLGITCNASAEGSPAAAMARVQSCFDATHCANIREHFPAINDRVVAAVAKARSLGGRPILQPELVPGASSSAYAQACRDTVAAFGPCIIEFGSEPGYPWRTPKIPGGDYAKIVREAGKAVRTVDPQGLCVRLAAMDGGYGPDWWPNATAAVPDIATYFDANAAHPYHNALRANDLAPLWPWGYSRPHSWNGKPVYLTECGAATGTDLVGNTAPGISEQAQADWLRAAYTMAKAVPYVPWLSVYMDHDLRAGSRSTLDNMGVAYRAGGTTKPAAAAFRALALQSSTNTSATRTA